MPMHATCPDDEFLEAYFTDWAELRFAAALADEGRPLPPLMPPVPYSPPPMACDPESVEAF